MAANPQFKEERLDALREEAARTGKVQDHGVAPVGSPFPKPASAYGYRRIHAELWRRGWKTNHKCVLRLMRGDNLLCVRRRKFILTTRSHHGLPVYPNLAESLVLSSIDQLWIADITYIRLQWEFVYLAVLLDAFSRRCIGWRCSAPWKWPSYWRPCA